MLSQKGSSKLELDWDNAIKLSLLTNGMTNTIQQDGYLLIRIIVCCGYGSLQLNNKVIAATSAEVGTGGGSTYDCNSIFVKKGDVLSFSGSGIHSYDSYSAELFLIPYK